MAFHVLENEQIKVMIADAGAELSSVYDKESGLERLWDANPKVWNRHAPILFPFVGKVIGGVYRIDGKEYPMKTQHGFARDMEFECVEANENSVVHRLKSTEKTLEIYPYEFELLVTHALDGENPRLLHVNWEVRNPGREVMYYSIGGHPAFTIPEQDGKAREQYYLEFPGREELTFVGVPDNFVDADQVHELKLENGFVKVNQDVYDTLVFDHQKIDVVRLAKPDKTPYVTLCCGDFPLLGIWANGNPDCNFICLEPWAGRTDNKGFTGNIEEKVAEQKLEGGCSAQFTHTIEFHR